MNGTMSARTRFLLWLLAAAALFGGQLAWLFLLRGRRLLQSDVTLIVGPLALGAPLLAIAALLATTPANAIKLRRRTSEILLVAGGAVLQLAAVVLLRPALSEDVLRYRADGRMWLAGASPYATAPRDFDGADAVDALVPFPDVRTIYPGTSHAVFALAAAAERALGAAPASVPAFPRGERIGAAPASIGALPRDEHSLAANAASPPHASPPAASISVASPPHASLAAISHGERSAWRWYLGNADAPYRATVFRSTYAACAVGCALVLLGMLRRSGQSPWWAALLAWNPLVTLETGGMGHQDALGALLVLLALSAAQRAHPARARAMLWLALAAGVKPLALLIAPFLIRGGGQRAPLPGDGRFRSRLLPVGVFAAALVALYLAPLLIHGGAAGWRASAGAYSQTWEANGSFYEGIKFVFGTGDEGRAMDRAKQMARLLAAAALLAAALACWRFRASPATAGYWLCLVTLLVSPVAYPWYLVWVLAMVPLLDGRPGWAALVWSATATISYRVWRSPDWHLDAPWALAEYVPVYLAAATELALSARRALREASAPREPGDTGDAGASAAAVKASGAAAGGGDGSGY
ncbi:MAG TPA: glycosyltransferase 87 family protein [Tepidisphaeraceae bacterium]|nr:glycosyltransferase 87 family protein [Tepidisphaeraceae bacterium]